jgi:hypothetical protein
MMRLLSGIAALALIGLTAPLGAQTTGQAKPPAKPPAPAAAAATNDVSVTVTYTGKGVVDASHSILLFLFTDPNISSESQPIGPPETITKNGGTATFKNVSPKIVYVVALYNETPGYNGQGGPPPVGTPMAIYAKDAKSPALGVTPGPKTAIKISFDGTKRFGQ